MIINELEGKVKGKGIRIVFTEGWDPRVQRAVIDLQANDVVHPILLGSPEQIQKCSEENGLDVSNIEQIDPLNYDGIEEMAVKMVELRRGKMDLEQCRKALQSSNYFGTMLVQMGIADGLLGGATYSTADTIRPALQLVKTAPGQPLVSSCFLLVKGSEQYIMGDCSININPTPDELVEITVQTAHTARQFGIEPKVALLSYSSMGSAKGECVAKMAEAATRLKRMPIDFEVDGEMQFDCAVAPEVAALKAPNSKVAGHANTFIFPNLSSGNIGYKIAARLGGWQAIGPVLQGLNAPINDLSRGCTSQEIYKMAIVTAAQKALGI
ncbi:phosphate acetyltransferase [Faecalicoccus pleomorphus]|mgnify:FL=1|uniref:Phosphate acetyltransferase n=1 Tax=Faecalicoccus pleomorphus TaxID=1323 RepID=A0A380LME8_9FIRM|nr:phosphate acetyltransferase [Faecalicoccus pleomorphus]MBM6764600.1 phosphate acetyltransferase [Faecalicoccus pleomorphus]MBM6807791.1 phosphate acetyltransferase [Faecalicoccus pleomorphus]SUO04443.1 phosphotransacetylase [Faecalicoccus pleomorphus]